MGRATRSSSSRRIVTQRRVTRQSKPTNK
jgi:hypothetical protein